MGHKPLGDNSDRRCWLWRKDGTPAGEFVVPPSATQFPTAFVVLDPEEVVLYRQDPGDAHMYRAQV